VRPLRPAGLIHPPTDDVPAIAKRTETVKFTVQRRSMRSMTYEHAIFRAIQKSPHFRVVGVKTTSS